MSIVELMGNLTEAEMAYEDRENQKHLWGFSTSMLYAQIRRFEKGDERVKARVCYRLEDANFHTLCGLLADGDVEGAKVWVEKNMTEVAA